MQRITGVALNPCIDKTVEIDAFTYGGMNRIRFSRADGSGKGVNVALCARALGFEAACTGFLGEDNGLIETRLQNAGVDFRFARTKGAVRTNLKLFDRSTQRITEINESGVSPEKEQLRELEGLVEEYAHVSSVLVFTGSLPPGMPEDTYAHLMEIASPYCDCVLDAEGEKLRLGLPLRPLLVKPNSYELEMLAGRPLGGLGEIRAAAEELLKAGARMVAVSMGSDGAMLVSGDEAWYAPCVPVTVRSTVGAGDSMVVGLLCGILQGAPLSETLRMGAAAGTAAVVTEGTELFDRKGFDEMLPRVRVERL